MARLLLNNYDLTWKLPGFSLNCKECKGTEVVFDIDYTDTRSYTGLNITVTCTNPECDHKESIYTYANF